MPDNKKGQTKASQKKGLNPLRSRSPFAKINQNNDESPSSDQPKNIHQILNEQIRAGLEEFKRSNFSLFLSALTAGLEIGFSVLFMCTVLTLYGNTAISSSIQMYLALCYPIGFIFVIIGRSELFTEHTALALLPVLNDSVPLKQLFTLWGVIYAGNIIGGILFSFLIVNIGPSVGFIELWAFEELARKLSDYPWYIILLSAIFAGWMMGLLGWLVTSSQDTISRIMLIILVTAIIGLAGLHHCIIGSIEVFSGLIISENITVSDYLKFQGFATLGNAIGGSLFVSILKFSHIRIG